MKEIVANMDDVALDGPSANGMSWIYHLKGKFPKFKITLFTIPARSTWGWLLMLNQIPWIELAMHGWHHDEKEDINQYMLDKWPYKKIYKGPNWKVDDYELKLLRTNKYTLAVKEPIKFAIRQWSLTDPRAVHGHVWIENDWKRLEKEIEKDTEFRFISEVL